LKNERGKRTEPKPRGKATGRFGILKWRRARQFSPSGRRRGKRGGRNSTEKEEGKEWGKTGPTLERRGWGAQDTSRGTLKGGRSQIRGGKKTVLRRGEESRCQVLGAKEKANRKAMQRKNLLSRSHREHCGLAAEGGSRGGRRRARAGLVNEQREDGEENAEDWGGEPRKREIKKVTRKTGRLKIEFRKKKRRDRHGTRFSWDSEEKGRGSAEKAQSDKQEETK